MITLQLTLDDARALSGSQATRWKAVCDGVWKYDVPYIVFLGELLGILDGDPDPRFTASVYTNVDMFGGCEQRWRLRTRHITLRREISQAISESWQHVDVEDDFVRITGLPARMFLDWDGGLGFGMTITVGNIAAALEPAVLSLARQLFRKVEVARSEASGYRKVAAGLKRAYRNASLGDAASDPWVPSPQEISDTVAALMDADDDVALGALKLLARHDMLARPEVRPGLLEALQSGANLARGAIAEALGSRGGSENVAPLARALADGSSSVRENAVSALGRIGDPQAVPALLHALHDRHFKVRWYALAALSELVTDAQWPDVCRAILPLLADESHYVRGVAVELLGEHAAPELAEPLLGCLADHDGQVRAKAAQILGQIGDRRAVDGMSQLLADNESSVRAAAAESLGRLGDPRAVPALQEALYWASKDEPLRKALEQALTALGAEPVPLPPKKR